MAEPYLRNWSATLTLQLWLQERAGERLNQTAMVWLGVANNYVINLSGVDQVA